MASLNEAVPDSLKGTASGAYYLFWGLGYFLGPLIAGQLGDTIGFSIGFYMLSGLLGVEAIALVPIGTPDK
jgi:MFS family permease